MEIHVKNHYEHLDGFGLKVGCISPCFLKRFSLKRFLKRCNFKHLDGFGLKVGCISPCFLKIFSLKRFLKRCNFINIIIKNIKLCGNTCKKSLLTFGLFWTALDSFWIQSWMYKRKDVFLKDFHSKDF